MWAGGGLAGWEPGGRRPVGLWGLGAGCYGLLAAVVWALQAAAALWPLRVRSSARALGHPPPLRPPRRCAPRGATTQPTAPLWPSSRPSARTCWTACSRSSRTTGGGQGRLKSAAPSAARGQRLAQRQRPLAAQRSWRGAACAPGPLQRTASERASPPGLPLLVGPGAGASRGARPAPARPHTPRPRAHAPALPPGSRSTASCSTPG